MSQGQLHIEGIERRLRCNVCRESKPMSEFYPRKSRKRGFQSRCKQCELIYANSPHGRALANKRVTAFRKRMQRENPTEWKRREREYNLQRKYGFGQDEYERLLEAAGGICAICGCKPTKGRGKKLHVDHDHETGEVRGLLCGNCNISLGGFQDDPAILQKAIDYLNFHKERN